MKKKERIAKIISEISDDMIEQAASINNKKDFSALKTRETRWSKWIAIAACLIFIIGITTVLSNPRDRHTHSKLPILTIDSEGFFAGGMGFEGLEAYDISEIVDSNPWTEATNIDSLPVFENIYSYDENGQRPRSDVESMKAQGMKIAEKLGMDLNSIIISDDEMDEEMKNEIIEESQGELPDGYFDIHYMIFEDENFEIQIDWDMGTVITFKPPVKLPNEYNFTFHAPYEDIVSVAEYLKNEYSSYLDMENPVTNIYGGNYNIYSQQYFDISFFNKSSDIVENMLNYNLNSVSLNCDEEGNLRAIVYDYADLSEKIGDYPIITRDEAEKLLLDGKYITTVPGKFPGREYIRKTELVYRTSHYEKLIFPYYRIHVEIPNMDHDNENLNTYGAYYVPAVEEKYIENMPLWDGSFN